MEAHFIKSAEKLRGLNIRMLIYFFMLLPENLVKEKEEKEQEQEREGEKERGSCCPISSTIILNKSEVKDFLLPALLH